MHNKVSVVITTKDRANDLKHCLGSLAGQVVSPDELVIIDNSSFDETKKMVENFAKSVKFPVCHFLQKEVGYPHVYNRGLREATGNWVAFIDDDCVADTTWFMRIKFITKNFPHLAAILGNSREYFSKRTLSLTKSLVDEMGKIGAIKNRLISDHEILDSKNIAYNKNFLNKHGIFFDVNLLNYAQGASEDCDLGMQIGLARGIAIYDEKMTVSHKDPSSVLAYYKKVKFTLFNHLIYEKKWHTLRLQYLTQRPFYKKMELIKKFIDRYKLSFAASFLVIFNLAVTFFYIKILRLSLKKEIGKISIAAYDKR